jgi:hypothetical protein
VWVSQTEDEWAALPIPILLTRDEEMRECVLVDGPRTMFYMAVRLRATQTEATRYLNFLIRHLELFRQFTTEDAAGVR